MENKNQKEEGVQVARGDSFSRIFLNQAKGILSSFTKKFRTISLVVSFSVLLFALCMSCISYNLSRRVDEASVGGHDTISQEEGEVLGFNLKRSMFAASFENESSDVVPSVPYSKIEISEISNLAAFAANEGVTLSAGQMAALEEYGFFLAENGSITDQSGFADTDDFVDTYSDFAGSNSIYRRQESDAIFVSTDMALHLYHLLIDRSFQAIEQEKFQPMLREMTKALLKDSLEKYDSAEDEDLKDSYKLLSAYYLVPLVILDAGSQSSGIDIKPEDYLTFAAYLEAVGEQQVADSETDLKFSLESKEYDGIKIDDGIYEIAKTELELMAEANQVIKSPLFSAFRLELVNDYTQFKPRSHYTKNDVLKSYFISMMWYGRMGFTLNSPELTRAALLSTKQINTLKVGDENLSDLWSKIMDTVDFFVGEVDDLTAYDYTEVMQKVYKTGLDDSVFADDTLLEEFIKRAKTELPNPRIISEAVGVYDDAGERDELLANLKQFRFMPQRFTPDAYVLNTLTQGVGSPDEETGQNLPSMPTALMPIRIIAPENKTVKKYLDEWISDSARIAWQNRESDKIIEKRLGELDEEFAAYDDSVWTQNIYWSWLDCFSSLLDGYGEGYPYFMQTENWQKKNLGTVLGSFTELKHDTLLYAKQSYAEMGGGGDEEEIPPVAKGYVEPDIVFWNKIINLAKKTQYGLEEEGVFPEEFDLKYAAFIEIAEFMRDMSEKELQNEIISDDEFEKLRTIDSSFEIISRAISGELSQKDKRAGIVADIHTDVSSVADENDILYEATGKPYVIYVAIKDANGTRLTRGAVYSHFEFTDALGERISDEDWQKIVYEGEGELPEADTWSLELIK
ncbi:MAG: DUF3160 domain-containing protein [Candidatus Pacebacteria bacterium]|nr:DUF3160 domain-containing protein [Candidatus Paceibacterota bacterium]